jgi:HD-GYP domain-containing protein (c-di-GMP phosphodiesterase class II)
MATERLVVLNGPLQGHVVSIDGVLSIGRAPDNTLHLDDLQVSRKHATIEQGPKGTVLRDLGSGNGTYIDSRRVLETRLSNGTVIRIGQQDLRFETDAVIQTPGTDYGMGDSGVRFQSGPQQAVTADAAENLCATFFQAPAAASSGQDLAEMQRRLRAVYAANQAIASERDLTRLFEIVMEQIFSLVPAHNGVIILRDRQAAKGRSTTVMKLGHSTALDGLVTEYVRSGVNGEEVTISSSIVRRAIENKEAVLTVDAADDARFESGASIIQENISSAMCVPLVYQSDVLGVIYVDTRGTTNAFVNRDLELVCAIAGPAATSISNAQYVRKLDQAYQDTLIALAGTIELRDHYTVGHNWRVAKYSVEIARELGWTPEKLKEVETGCVLHDIGKVAVEDAVLRKPGKLTEEEYAQMKIHPERGAALLQDVEALHPLIPYCLYHHERPDGKGYPYGLKGEEIPVEGRVVGVADCWDALTSNRPYRQGMDPQKAISIIEEGRGTQFDPICADAFIKCFREGRINAVLQNYHATDEKSVVCPFCSTNIRFPDGTDLGATFDCHVCHRGVKLRQMETGVYFGELIPQVGGARITGQALPIHERPPA